MDSEIQPATKGDSVVAVYLATTPNYWGRGSSPDEALAALRRAGGGTHLKRYGYVVRRMPDGAVDARVDSGGQIWWDGAPGEPIIVAVCVPALSAAEKRVLVEPRRTVLAARHGRLGSPA